MTSEPNIANATIDQTNIHFNTAHLSVLHTISLISCGMFMYTGWGIFIAIPASVIFSIFYSAIFKKALKQSNPKTFAVYTVTFTLVFAYASILFNAGIATDSPQIMYLAPSLLEVSSDNFDQAFSPLFTVSFIYLFLSLPINLFLIRKNVSRFSFSLVPLIGILLLAIHWGIVLKELPELKIQKATEQREAQQREQSAIDASYDFNWSTVNEKTFKNRSYSIFTPPTPSTPVPISQCPYTTNLIEQYATNSGFNIYCLNDVLKQVGQVPITETEVLGIHIPNPSNAIKKGDVLVVVGKLESPSMMRVHADGNAAKDCTCQMAPYDYSEIDAYIETENSTVAYEQSVIQTQVIDRERTVMILYPINIDGLQDINIKLSQFSDVPNIPVTLQEVSVLSPTVVPPDPEWLQEWSKKPNPFIQR